MGEYKPFEGYRLTSPFGMRRHPLPPHKLKFHRGVDLVTTPSDGTIAAKVAGEVTHAKMGVAHSGIPSEMGIVVAVKDDKGYLHVYAHLSAALVKVGQKVEREQVIGRQGTTGKDAEGKSTSTAPHLHYEIRKVSTPVFGWTKTEVGVVEPTQYLIDHYKPKEEEHMLTVADANKIIALLGAVWQVTDTPDSTNAGQNEAGRLANELRKASGQPTT